MRDDQIEQFLTRQLFRLRLAHGWTQQRLALQAGLTRSTYAAIEVQNVRAQAAALWKISRALGCEVCELLPAANGPAPGTTTASLLLCDHRSLFRFRELVKLSQASGEALLMLERQTPSFVMTFQIDQRQREILAGVLLNGKGLDSWMHVSQRRSVQSLALFLKQSKLESWLKRLAEVWLAEWLLRISGNSQHRLRTQ